MPGSAGGRREKDQPSWHLALRPTHLVPLRAAVELTFGWLVLHRRLARDYETLPTRSRTMILWGMIDNESGSDVL